MATGCAITFSKMAHRWRNGAPNHRTTASVASFKRIMVTACTHVSKYRDLTVICRTNRRDRLLVEDGFKSLSAVLYG
jgi:hypothetical protein